MISRLPFAVPAILILSTFAFAEEKLPKFIASDTDFHLLQGVVQGHIEGQPAHQIGKTFFRGAGKATSWNEAESRCKELNPSGKWQLPTLVDVWTDLMTGASQAGVPSALREDASAYPYWIRHENAKKNTRLSENSEFIMIQDGQGESHEAVSFAQIRALANADISRVPAENRARFKEFVKSMKDGVTVFCVTDAKFVDAKPIESYKLSDVKSKQLPAPAGQGSPDPGATPNADRAR